MRPLNRPLADWHGSVAWIVGASSGIGRAVAHELHRSGAQVAVSARNAAALEEFSLEHPGSLACPLDVSDSEALRRTAQELFDRRGRLDLVMYCAGHYRPMRATHFDLAEMLRHQDVNYVGALRLLDAVLPLLLRSGHGHLSLVGSVAGYRGLPLSLAYGPTKAALRHLAEILYLDLHDQGLDVSIISPGFVATPLTAQNGFRMPALISPEEAASQILRGWARGQFEIDFPKRFTIWLKLLGMVPARLHFAAVRQAGL